MKKLIHVFFALTLGLLIAGCAKEYDDTELQGKVDKLTQDVNTLKANQAAMQAVIDVWKAGGYVQSIDNSVPGQHTITFYGENGKTVVLYDGKDGNDGAQGPQGADGDSFFKSIIPTEDGVTFIMNDEAETTFTIPFAKAFKLVIENTEAEVEAGKEVEFPYTVQNANSTTTVDVFAGGNYAAVVNETDKKIVVTAPDPVANGSVLAWAQNEEGLFSMKKLNFFQKADTKVITTEEAYQAIHAEAGEFVVDLVSNVDIVVPAPDVDWVTVAVTKADYKLTLTLTDNTTGAPREVVLKINRADNGKQVQEIKIIQLFGEPEPEPVAYYLFNGAAGKHGISTTSSSYVPATWSAPNSLETVPAGYPENAGWKVTLGNVQDNGAGDFWFGSNSGNKAKLTLGSSEYPEDAAIATALEVQTTATYYGALVCTTNFPNISKIEISSASEMGGGQATTMWVVKSTDNGATYSVVKKIDAPAKAANTKFTVKIAKADRSESASYALVFYRSGGQFQYKAPQILFYSADPSSPEPEKVLTVERVWGKYPVAVGKAWTTEYAEAAPYIVGNDRTMAADDKYVYVAAASSSTKGILAINLADPAQVKDVNVTGVEGGFFATACVRTIYDPATQKYILLAGTLAHDTDCTFKVYAWKDGIDSAPSVLINWNTNNGSPRRVGDFFTVSGDWANGEIWVRINETGKSTSFKWNITNGEAGSVLGGGMGYGGSAGMGSIYKYNVAAKQVVLVTPTIGRFFKYQDNDGWLNVNSDGVDWAGIDNSVMARKFGITPFEFNGKKYIAYVKKGFYDNSGNAARARVKIIEDQGSAETFLASLETDNVLYEFPIQNKNNAKTAEEFNEVYFTDGPSIAGQEMANCAVVPGEDCVYIVGHLFNVGVSVFKMYMK